MYVAYIRCSTNIQENSPERQRDEITAWANNQGASIDEWFVELPISGSASIAERPQLTAALDSLQKNDSIDNPYPTDPRVTYDRMVLVGLADNQPSYTWE